MSERPSTPPVAQGDVLAGRYRVERVIGAGGMGVVVEAMHLELDERVAMKFLLPHAIESAEAATRFVREARAAVKIKSEHVARVTDVGRLENGAPYIVMEFLQGSDLSVVLQRGPLSIEDSVDYVIQASDAMAEAHAAGIVHRDLKPSNLFLAARPDGTPIIKVLDFGISKVNVPDTSEAALTRTTTIMGSPFYMSPEQMRSSKDVDLRTDIWALGVILHELLSGTPPFNGETLPQLVAQILSEPPPSLLTRRPDVPPELDAIVAHCLEKDRDRRFQSVGAMAQALVNFGSRRSRYTAERIMRMSGLDLPGSSRVPTGTLLATSPGMQSGGSTAPGTSTPTGARTNTAWTDTNRGAPQGRTAAFALGGLAVVGVLGVGAFFALRGHSAATSETAASAAPPTPETRAAVPAAAPAPVEVAPLAVPPAPEPTPQASSAPSAAPRPTGARPAPPRPSAARTPATTPTAAPAPAPAPAPTRSKNPLSIDLK